jgi:hypothetical protein
MTHAQISPTGRRPDFAASYHARKQSYAPLFTVTNKHLLKAAADAAKALKLNPKERQVLTELEHCPIKLHRNRMRRSSSCTLGA